MKRNSSAAGPTKGSVSTPIGHLACFVAYIIFGYNLIVTKQLSDSGVISPMGLFYFRAGGATILFWLLSFLFPRHERVAPKDFPKIFAASMLGLFVTQWCFLKAMTMTTPMDGSILGTFSPVFTMLVAAVVIKEPITWKKAGGVALSFVGIMLLILTSKGLGDGESAVTRTTPQGAIFMLLNSLCFAMYLGIFRPLISRYGVVTFMKWMFLFSMLAATPFAIKEIVNLPYASIPASYYWELAYLVVFSTFLAYYLVPIAQKSLRPTMVSLYSYVQPIIASVMGIYLGMDKLTWPKILAACAVVCGAILVNRSRAKETPTQAYKQAK